MDPFDLRLWDGFEQAGGSLKEPATVDQVTIDSRQIDSKNSLFIALSGKQKDGHLFVPHAEKWGAKYAIVKKGYIPEETVCQTQLLYVENPVSALQEISKAYRNTLPIKIFAITGSHGKTMVKDLLQELLKEHFECKASPESFNSQIGVPLSLFTLSKTNQIALIEAAISEKDEMNRLQDILKPDFGIITQIEKKHFQDIPSLIEELIKLFNNNPEWVFLPYSNEILPFLNQIKAPAHFWNKHDGKSPHASHLSEKYELSIPYHIRFPSNNSYQGIITSGFYYYLDLLNMAIKAAYKLGIPEAHICKTLDRYTLEPIRKEIWKSPENITFINDSYAEDPLSIDAALKFANSNSGNGRKIFLFEGLKGDRSENDYRKAGIILSEYPLDFLFLIGEHPFEPLIASHSNPSTTIIRAENYAEAFEIYKLSMHSGDTLLIKGTKKEPIETLIKNFHESLCTSLCQVNLASIEHNIKILRNNIPNDTRVMVMVKAFAYGTDSFRMGKFLHTCGVDILGVSYVEEAVALKQTGVTSSIFVLNAADYEVDQVVKWDLEVGASSKAFIEKLAYSAEKAEKPIKVHLHIDTGMGRFGGRPEDALELALAIERYPFLILDGIMTHFASADNPEEDAFTYSQVEKFDKVIKELKDNGISPKWKHAANSAGVLRFAFPQYNMVRVGLAVYGLKPTPGQFNLKLAVSLFSKIAGINTCKKGETISYGRSYVVQEEEKRIAVLPIGYFDGLHRNYSNSGNVIIRGKLAPMIGNICMDFMMVDISNIPEANLGDPVLIFGNDDRGHYLSPETLALQGKSISHELITCLGPRIQRFFIYEESNQKEPS